jgi:uncharacterized protein YcbX
VRVQELWRYPVKSLQGERLHQALVTAHGLDGDRRYATSCSKPECGARSGDYRVLRGLVMGSR